MTSLDFVAAAFAIYSTGLICGYVLRANWTEQKVNFIIGFLGVMSVVFLSALMLGMIALIGTRVFN